mgnify:CR=1 FL=1
MANELILCVDDEAHILELLTFNLEASGYRVVTAENGEDALVVCARERPAMILLDIMLPGIDGVEVCRRLKSTTTTSDIPIIMLTAKGDEVDKILGLEMGADDYITKPFSPREVVARVKVVLRRILTRKEEAANGHLVIGNLDIDMNAFIVRLGGQIVPCTPKETEILWTLASNPGTVFSRDQLLQTIWGYDFPGDTRAVDSHIKRLRAKLCDAGNAWDIKTVWGVGYRFEQGK